MRKEESYADGYEAIPGWELIDQVEEEEERLVHLINLAAGASAIPRRLGSDASPEELAADKKIARGLVHRFRTLLREWREVGELPGGDEADIDKEAAREGARVDWPTWRQDWQADLIARRGAVAATLAPDDEERAARLCHLYSRELWLVEQLFDRWLPSRGRAGGRVRKPSSV